ncbi:MAG: PspA/IM30 family protein [Myxococcota bacterium]
MRLWDRMSRQVRADAHGVMDRLEERSLLLKQHLREAELELDRKRARLETLDEEARRVAEQQESEARQIAGLDEDVELALAGGKDELARFAVRRLLPHRRAVARLAERREEIERERARRVERLATQEEQLRELRERVRTRIAEEEASWSSPWARGESVADEEVELELLRRRRGASAGEER